MKIELRPPYGAGPVSIGMERSVARRALELLGGAVEDFRRTPAARQGLRLVTLSGVSLFVYFDDDDQVEAVEVGRPFRAGNAVMYRGLDVFSTPVVDLVTQLRRSTVVIEEEDGHSYVASDLLLALWRSGTPEGPDDEYGRHFEAVLVASPGFYG